MNALHLLVNYISHAFQLFCNYSTTDYRSASWLAGIESLLPEQTRLVAVEVEERGLPLVRPSLVEGRLEGVLGPAVGGLQGRHHHALDHDAQSLDGGEDDSPDECVLPGGLESGSDGEDSAGGRARENGVPGVLLPPESGEGAVEAGEADAPYGEAPRDDGYPRLDPVRLRPLGVPEIEQLKFTICCIISPRGAFLAPPTECQISPPTIPKTKAPPASSTTRQGQGSRSIAAAAI